MPQTIENVNTLSHCDELVANAKQAKRQLMTLSGQKRNEILDRMADKIAQQKAHLQSENEKDLVYGRENGLAEAMIDRLTLTDLRIEDMIDSIRQIAAQPDPIGNIIEGRNLANGIRLQKMAVPIGVVLIIFESRPNVTSDAAALCIKSGNAVILRGGKEAFYSNQAIANCIQSAFEESQVSIGCAQLVGTTDREAVSLLLKRQGDIDLAIPRGGKSLIKTVVEQSHIPVIKHYTGNCHLYIDEHCNPNMAVDLCVNSKTQRTGVCNATESILIHESHVESGLLKQICQALSEKGVEIRGDEAVKKTFESAVQATENDWEEEYLDLIVALKTVTDLKSAVNHINQYGSGHTDAIITNQIDAAQTFIQSVETANAFVNCSTRFSDGGQYGLGAEIGISTDKLHARGPMGAQDLTTYQWVAWGNGQTRE